MNLGRLLHDQAVQIPHAVALHCHDRTMSYRELDESSSRLALWFIERGLKPGGRVAVHWPNSIELVQLFFGLFKAGLVVVPINLRLKSAEVAWILRHAQPALCFSQPSLAPIAQPAAAGCPGLQGILTQLPQHSPQATLSLAAVGEDQPAAILYTSGSTADPKGVVHTHRTLGAAVRFVANDLLESGDTVLTMTPMMHALGLGGAVLPGLSRGLPVVLLPVFEPAAALAAIERFRCTYTITLPALLQLLVDEQAVRPRDAGSLRTVLAGGDSVPLKLQERFAALFGLPIREAIGMSETFPIAVNPRHAVRPGSVGAPLAGVQMRIVDGAARPVGSGETGELAVRSPANCSGYWNDPVATAQLLRGNWLHTGDLMRRDAEGYYWFRGRKKQIIVRGGSNISPQEVEEVLYGHPAVFEAGVIGAPDPTYGERVIAFVSLRNGAAPDERILRDYVRTSLADYKVPERIIFVPELPKGTTGKVERTALRVLLADARL